MNFSLFMILSILIPYIIFASAMDPCNWVIIANGPKVTKRQLEIAIKNRKMIALDGAANYLKDFNIHPDVILGDFDSITNLDYWGINATFHELENSTPHYEGNFGIIIAPAKDQNHTDMQKAIMYCDSQKAHSIVIINATGDRLDHTLGNIGTLRKYYNPNRPILIQTEREYIEYIKNGSTVIHGHVGDYCAVMGYPQARMTTTGLSYNGENYELNLGFQEGICNTLAEERASIWIEGEALVIHPLKY